ncbi:MAG: 30S ribosomal protein S3 [Betaproteobacteria bacterium]|nr:30S ribosomal protein S3 [Betaproteobacteria bacterium]
MGQKINPIGFRLAMRRNWDSQWFARKRDFAEQVLLDYKLREHIESKYAQAMIAKIEILRQQKIKINIHCVKPGMIIGRKGGDIDTLRAHARKMCNSGEVEVDIREIRQPESNATLVALNIAAQLEKRVMFRRAMRRALLSAERVGVQGIKIMCKGRLNGAEIARFERYHRGRVPLHTLRAKIDYGFAQAKTSMGVIGIKVWIFHGESAARQKQNRALEDEAFSRKVEIGADGEGEVKPSAETDTSETEEMIAEASKKAAQVRSRSGRNIDDVGADDHFDEDDFADDLDDLQDDAGT